MGGENSTSALQNASYITDDGNNKVLRAVSQQAPFNRDNVHLCLLIVKLRFTAASTNPEHHVRVCV